MIYDEAQMGGKQQALLAVAMVVVIGGGFWYFSRTANQTAAFSDLAIETDENVINQMAQGYVSLPSLSADPDSIADLVGAIAIRTRTADGKEEWSTDIRFRPSRDLVRLKIIDERLYQGIVSAKASFGGRYQIASGDAKGDELAEVLIRNQLTAGYKNSSDIPFQDLAKIRPTPNKDYFFIESLVVTDITARRFSKQSGGGAIKGLAFGANGNVYAERDTLKTQKIVSFRPINILNLRSAESGSGDTATDLILKSRQKLLSDEEAEKLVNVLKEKAKLSAPAVIKSLPRVEVSSGLPERLRTFEKIVWHGNVVPQRQSSINRCWAATIAMMYSWKTGRQVDEKEATSALGPSFESLYKNDAPLPNSYKLDLIKYANLKFAAPQSYTERGLIELLENHGPVWFTIDKDFGRHATILTGVFLSPVTKEYWVSYLDPAVGLLLADTYVSYMRRYEAPAFRENSAGGTLAMTEQDLDIQVIHW